MKQKLILFIICCLCTLSVVGQGTVTRQSKPKTQQATQSKPTTQKTTQSKPKQTTKTQSSSQPTQQAKPVQSEPTAYDVTFTCNVSTATLYIDGNNYGTPSGTRTLKTGSHSVRLTANGYEDYTSTIDVNGNNHSFNFTMKQKPTPTVTQTPTPTPTPTSTATATVSESNKKTFTANGVSFKMVYVEGGTFTMGATSEQGSDARDDEKPTHSVTLSNYYIGETEVTQELWKAVMKKNPSNFKGDSRLPVEKVSWEDCQKFISKLNSLTGQQFRLPTEAEWEYAARGGNKSKKYKYSGSNDIGSVAWYRDNSGDQTHPVKMKAPNELGIYDMTGNVREWCQGWYYSYSSGSQTNPTGASSGSLLVCRGGCWISDAPYCRSTFRSYYNSSFLRYNIGLRLVL